MHMIIIGASGLVGRDVLYKSLKDERISKVTCIVRKSLEVLDPKFTQIVMKPFESKSIESLELKGDFYFCALGTTIKRADSKEAFKKVDLDYVVSFGKLARKFNGYLGVISSLGASESSPFFYNKTKGMMEGSLRSLELRGLYIFRPSLLIGDREERRIAEAFGISLYRLFSPLLPQSISSKLGTRVNSLSSCILKVFFQKSEGPAIVSSFD